MHTHCIKARSKRKFVVTTDSKNDLPIAENLLARDFTPAAPDGSGAATSPTSPPTKVGCTWQR
jgi:hypothetical protein